MTKIASLVVALLFWSFAAHAGISLIENGKSRAVICAPARVMAPDIATDPDPNTAASIAEEQRRRLRESVRDLSKYLEQITGAPVEIVTEAQESSANRVPLLVGEFAEKVFGPVGKTAPYKQGFRYVVSPKGLGFYGESDLAASYAIYELLDRLGCRWYMPSDLGEVIPQMSSINVEETDLSSAPATIYRGAWFTGPEYFRRNRQGGFPVNARHVLEKYITPQERQEHPDWMAEIDSVRHARYLKWNSKGLAEAIAKSINTSLDKVPRGDVSLTSAATVEFDNSEAEKKFDAGDYDPQTGKISVTDRLMVFANRVAGLVLEKHPDVIFGIHSWGQTGRPPVREKVNPHIIPMLALVNYDRTHPIMDQTAPGNKVQLANLEGWAKACPRISYYPYAFLLADPAAPYPLIRKWSEDIPIFYKNNCVFWQPETKATFESTMHGLYLGNRLAWDPKQDSVKIVAELNERFYGNAGKQMADYWTFLDDIWTKTPEYAGAGYGHLQRFTPEITSQLRAKMDAALAACQTITEHKRVEIANLSLQQFELFLKMRRDLAEGRFAKLSQLAEIWRATGIALSQQYKDQYAFGIMSAADTRPYAVQIFDLLYADTYASATRVAREQEILTKPLTFKYHADKEKKGESEGWSTVDFDDSSWKETTPVLENWSNLGLYDYYGVLWYRGNFELSTSAEKGKIFLWIGGTDGSAEIFINGKSIPYSEKFPVYTGYAKAIAFDITPAIQSGKNQISIRCNRMELNEAGTGGLLGPVVVYREKNSKTK